DPAMHRQGDEGAAEDCQAEQARSNRDRRIPDPVEGEHRQERNDQSEDGPASGFDHLDRPDTLAELEELGFEGARQLQPIVRLNEAHSSLRKSHDGPVWLATVFISEAIHTRPMIFRPTQKTPMRMIRSAAGSG